MCLFYVICFLDAFVNLFFVAAFFLKKGDKLGTSWGQVGDKLGTSWGQVGDKLGTSWGQVGDKLGTSWGQVGTTEVLPEAVFLSSLHNDDQSFCL
jgi:Flp pilus assembly pilin Flp